MASQIFPEELYTRLLQHGERLKVNEEGKFELLPSESTLDSLKRFIFFQQDANIHQVHNKLKELVKQDHLQPEQSELAQEIHSKGKSNYRYLEANLVYLRNNLNDVGQLNLLSNLVLKVINFIHNIFRMEPIEIRSYARHYLEDGLQKTESSFKFSFSSEDYVNPFEQAGLQLTEEDKLNCVFAGSTPETQNKIQELEKGLEDYYCLHQSKKIHTLPNDETKHIQGNLEITFDKESQQFSVAIHNPEDPSRDPIVLAAFHNMEISSRDPSINPPTISEQVARHISELPDDEKTIRYSIVSKMGRRNERNQEIKWKITPTESSPFELDKGSQKLVLEPNIEHTFYNEAKEEVAKITITTRR